MATETLVRPAQTIRRRESSRPLVGTKRTADCDLAGSAVKRSRTFAEPYVRDTQYILKKHRGKPASLKIHLHSTHFRFDGQDGSFAYDSPMRFVLKHLQLQTVPHDMLEELLAAGVPFYDGCLIVEVHNHRDIEAQNTGAGTTHKGEDNKKFSIHNWNPHITPSAGASFPDKSQLEPDTTSNVNGAEDEAGLQAAGQQEPTITTLVLHPTEQTRHEEVLILARTPALDARRKKGADGSIPPTPALTAPPTPGPAGRGASQKMALDQAGLYSFQSESLVVTEAPLMLEPAENADHAFLILDSLRHPLHSGKPPAAKERKRTTAEMAADDAQAAESERRMLIMDERIKPSTRTGAGAATGETQASAASLGFSRFKTIENVKQKLEEQERLNKEKEVLAAQEKRQQEEAAAQQRLLQQQQQAAAHQQQQADKQARQQMMLQAQQKKAQQHALQQNELMKQMHAQQMQTAAMNNGLQAQQNAAFQASSMSAQQTPMMAHSSPMVGQNGYSMVPTSSQGAGSPPRPASAALAQQNGIGMSRGASQQTSMHNTPHIQQNGTPALANAVPNRNMSQTPHLNPSSPMVGTPSNNMAMNGVRLNANLDTAQQNLMLQQMQQNTQQANAGRVMAANGQMGQQGAALSAEQFQIARNMTRLSEHAKLHHAQAQQYAAAGDQGKATNAFRIAQAAQQQYNALRAKFLSGQANNSGAAQAATGQNHNHPAGVNGHVAQNNMAAASQQMNNAALLNQQAAMQQGHPVVNQQQQATMLRMQEQLRGLIAQHNGNIPQHIIAQLHPSMQQMLRQHLLRQQQQQMIRQSQARANMQMGNQGSPNPTQNAQYMQNMQALRNSMAMQMQQGNNQMMNGNMGMAMNNMQFANQRQGQQENGVGDLSQSFAAMHNALNRGNNVQ